MKSLLEGTITIKEVTYTLMVASNKRECIYEDDLFVGSKPYRYEDIIDKPLYLSDPLLIAAPEVIKEGNTNYLVDKIEVIHLPESLETRLIIYSPPTTSLILF